MGQKVHPLGFRVGITKNHQSQWFARFHKQKYAQTVLEDRMIRDTLSKLFPELLNPTRNSVVGKKRDEEVTVTPRITQIKIERGLIPYEIGIQIHAENCDLLKSAIDNLKVKRELIEKLQKTRRYFINLKDKLKEFNLETSKPNVIGNSNDSILSSTSVFNELKSKISKIRTRFGKKNMSSTFKKGFKFRPRLSKIEQKHKRRIKKRLKKRQIIRNRYRRFISRGLFIKKCGSKIVQNLVLKKKRYGSFSRSNKKSNNLNLKQNTNNNRYKRNLPIMDSEKTKGTRKNLRVTSPLLQRKKNTLISRIKKKFVTLFIQKMNKKFLGHLKFILSNVAKKQSTNLALLPLGFQKKWSLMRLNQLKTQPIYKLNRMIGLLEQKLLIKLELLRKEFIAFGALSAQNAQVIGYYQIVYFLKNLKEVLSKLRREKKLFALRRNHSTLKNTVTSMSLNPRATKLKLPEDLSNSSLTDKIISKKLNQVDLECRKIKLIEYLKDLVKTHRTKNIYLYLATLSDAKKNLKKIRNFTKRSSQFLFGFEKNSHLEMKNLIGEPLKEQLTNRLSLVLEKLSKKSQRDKTLSDTFLEQVEQQKTMCLDNLQLVPKISIKFYSVNTKTIEQKASIVAYSVVDALEKRKAFRKVVKDAKESLMRSAGVKGVKIQVAGRLNGAEIARTEWVRAGRVPLQTLRANLDYSYLTASTIYGIIGVKVWIFKGYTKLITQI